jgi:hypothetical protein
LCIAQHRKNKYGKIPCNYDQPVNMFFNFISPLCKNTFSNYSLCNDKDENDEVVGFVKVNIGVRQKTIKQILNLHVSSHWLFISIWRFNYEKRKGFGSHYFAYHKSDNWNREEKSLLVYHKSDNWNREETSLSCLSQVR